MVQALRSTSSRSDVRRTSFVLFLGMVGMIASFQGMYNILLPAAIERFDPAGKVQDLAILTTSAAIVTIVGLIIGGIISDRTRSRWGRRTPTIFFAAIGSIGLMIALGLARSVSALMILMPSVWFTLSLYQAALMAMLPDRIPPEHRGLASAAIAAGTPIGILVGTNAAAAATSSLGGYLVLSCLLAATTCIMFIVAPESSSLENESRTAQLTVNQHRGSLFAGFKSRNFTLTFVSRFLLFVSYFAVTGYLFYLVQDYIGTSGLPGQSAATAVTILLSIMTAAWLLVTPFTGYLADRVNHTPLIVGASSIGMGIAIFAPSISATWFAMIIFAVGMGACFGIYFAIDLKLMSMVLPSEEAAGRDLGVLSVATSAPQVLTPAVAGWSVAVGGYQLLFASGAALAILGGLTAFFIRVRESQNVHGGR
ncbi:MFS transporter [Sphingobium agri]|nr:MFS transporter [Sphingobium agri]